MIFGDLVNAACHVLFGAVYPPPVDNARVSPATLAGADALARGWREWIPDYIGTFPGAPRPQDFARVWIWRVEWTYPVAVEPNGLDPQMNVVGLLWKPWKESTEVTDKNTISPSKPQTSVKPGQDT